MPPTLEKQIASLEQTLLELEDSLDNKAMQLDDVATMGLMLTSILETEKVLSAFMEMATRMVSAEVGCIMLQEAGTLQTKISWGLEDKIIRTIKIDNDIDIAEWTLTSGESVVLNGVHLETDHQGKIEAIIALPIATHENRIGVLIVVNKADGGPFTEKDRENLEVLVRFAAVAIENANLLLESLEKQKLEQELELASQVQRALLPARSEALEGAVVEAVYRPAGQVGGDYYDIIRLSSTEFVVIVGDVSSKGIPAALMMAAVRSVFRLQARKDIPIAGLIVELNSFLCEQVLKTETMFISLVYAHFNLQNKTCTFVNAGHLPPIHYCSQNGSLKLWTTGGVILGQFPDFLYRSETVTLDTGDKILFFTDGVTESENQAGQLYGRERLQQFMSRYITLKPEEFTDRLMTDVEEFSGGKGAKPQDDLTTLLIEIV